MKKILLSIVAVGLLSVSAMASEGKVTKITIKANGSVLVEVTPTDMAIPVENKALIGTDDAKKAMLATALTAKSTNSIISTQMGSYDGTSGWEIVRLK